MGANEIDPSFTSLPLGELAAAALEAASRGGASYADFRLERVQRQGISTRDRTLQNLSSSVTTGYGVRVIVDGTWGFASAVDTSLQEAARTAERAVEVARALSPLTREPVELAPEQVWRGTYVSDYEIDPFTVPDDDKVALLLALNERVLASGKVAYVSSNAGLISECKYFASLSGSETTQQRIRVNGNFTATRVDKATGDFDTMSSMAPGVGRGWEWFTSGYDFARHADEIPALLEEKMAAPSVEPGSYDLVIDPTNLWLTIHESVGHSTELDRVLGHEAAYAGTSFCTFDKLGVLQYGSPVMHVTGDRTTPHGLSTIGYDDEGVAAQQWDIIRDGVLVGYQLNRQMAAQKGFERSNGCTFADSPHHVPLQRMPNISLQPASRDISLHDLIGGVDRGIYIVGNKSYSIDQQRYNFQFTGQRFYEIRNGKLGPQLKDVAYQATTTDFWGSMEAVGGPETFVLGGSFACGKGQPGQAAPVSHGTPAALFRNINVLNTREER